MEQSITYGRTKIIQAEQKRVFKKRSSSKASSLPVDNDVSCQRMSFKKRRCIYVTGVDCRGLAIFVFCGNEFLRLGQIGFSCWELIFAIFRKSRANY